MSRDESTRPEDNLGLVHLCANRFRGRGIEYDDLYGAGCMGLVKASRAFDASRGVKFSTYAVPVILGEIKRLFRDGGTVKVSRSLKELSLKITRASQTFAHKNGREPTVSELSDITGADPDDVIEALNASQPTVSLTIGDEDGESQTDLPTEPPDEDITDRLALRQVLSELSADDRKLIDLRYFKGMTQTAAAEKLGMTQVQVSRREKKLLTYMRTKLI
ncbi:MULTISPECIES: sigma-70 family RNA polymerase sigma factor [Ruminococcus]|uniref:RNA polymerase, sigma 28 subunit, FliA/WhiG subfamily n=1 Tax=Ruminococcus albus (strain ATCC 27210 / DSM 20455 / JCM 14654 / NCDO 2250 / 7) TaxID=697329 RepID=E6UBE0_RUMA7|nr:MULTISPECIES: sigma-70 family RNA polymerase sigma factor [Ruminococcus]ADU21490.1 RNA polymerase, sigma 28 subunit, FliA/WhiG subfamily [Ruminococcus albus 7 = DSM 20455]MCR5019914.1 sigma-70 family RNA polymerase sigma factor [Ruminococcus sp.]